MSYHDPFNPMPSHWERNERMRESARREGRSYWAVGVLAVMAGLLVAIVALA